MVTASIVLLYLSYSIPIFFLLYRGRSSIQHGPFWTGSFGLFSNIVLLAWSAFTLVMYSFPPAYPVQAGNMNYVCVVYGIVIFLLGIDWIVRGRREYRGVGDRAMEVSALERRVLDGVEVGSGNDNGSKIESEHQEATIVQ
jgi:choline transport protein